MPSASRSSEAQFSVSASQLIKLIKSVSSLILKKSHCYSLRFLRKAPTKKEKKKSHCYSLRFLRKAPTKKEKKESHCYSLRFLRKAPTRKLVE